MAKYILQCAIGNASRWLREAAQFKEGDYKFSRKNKPAYSVSDGERVIVETRDAFGGNVRNEKDLFDDVSMDEVNPATGPIQIEGVSVETHCAWKSRRSNAEEEGL